VPSSNSASLSTPVGFEVSAAAQSANWAKTPLSAGSTRARGLGKIEPVRVNTPNIPAARGQYGSAAFKCACHVLEKTTTTCSSPGRSAIERCPPIILSGGSLEEAHRIGEQVCDGAQRSTIEDHAIERVDAKQPRAQPVASGFAKSSSSDSVSRKRRNNSVQFLATLGSAKDCLLRQPAPANICTRTSECAIWRYAPNTGCER